MVAVVAAIIFMERGQRRIPVQYAKRVSPEDVTAVRARTSAQDQYLGVIPPIFASSILIFPGTIASFFPDNPWALRAADALSPQSPIYMLLYVALIIFFCYFSTAVTFNRWRFPTT